MAEKVAGREYESITGQLFEIGRQLRQKNGYPFNPNYLRQALQNCIEGKFYTENFLCEIDRSGIVNSINSFVIGLGLTGPEWIERMESKGDILSEWARKVLSSSDFISCEVGKKYSLAILPGKFFSDEERTTGNIRAEADRRGWITPETEIACLVREKLTVKQMESFTLEWIVTMHGLTKDLAGKSVLFSTQLHSDEILFDPRQDGPCRKWPSVSVFVFVVPED